MNKILYTFFLVSFSMLIFSACFQEDDIVTVHEAGNVETRIIEMGEKYSTQFFYDLEIQDYVSSNLNEVWDLAFECSDTAWHVLLNSAKMMHAGNAGPIAWESISNDPGVKMSFDHSGGSLDSTAIGEWYIYDATEILSKNELYIIDRGTDDNFESFGMKKIQISVLEDQYLLRYADLDGQNEGSIIIAKDEDYNFVHFSFEEGLVDVAPKKNEWSLKFSRYSTILLTEEGLPYPYSVTGILLNSNGVKASLKDLDFEQITLADTLNHAFSSRADFIGYDWKIYSLDEDKYVIEANKNYLIRDKDGLYYKMRFIDFYNEQGVRGSITFEVAKL